MSVTFLNITVDKNKTITLACTAVRVKTGSLVRNYFNSSDEK